jgi:hypothetical protein
MAMIDTPLAEGGVKRPARVIMYPIATQPKILRFGEKAQYDELRTEKTLKSFTFVDDLACRGRRHGGVIKWSLVPVVQPGKPPLKWLLVSMHR